MAPWMELPYEMENVTPEEEKVIKKCLLGGFSDGVCVCYMVRVTNSEIGDYHFFSRCLLISLKHLFVASFFFILNCSSLFCFTYSNCINVKFGT